MDETDGRIAALPCCLSWIKEDYGAVGSAPLETLWNSPGAQGIRELIATGRQQEICDRHCPYLMSGRHGEAALRIVDGPAEFVANQQLNLREIRERQTVLQSKPMLLKVLPTLRCNIRCTMCFQDHFGSVDLGEDFWGEIARLLPCAHEITFQGGEVTLDRGFQAFLDGEALRNHPHVRLNLITNGTVLGQVMINSLARARLNYVIVSVNAARRETFRAITAHDKFATVIENLRAWRAMAISHPRGPFVVYASFVVMRSNFRELPEFLELADALGVEAQLLHVIGDREGEDIFVRDDQHLALYTVLDAAAAIARGPAQEQVARIRKILDAHARPAPADPSNAVDGERGSACP